MANASRTINDLTKRNRSYAFAFVFLVTISLVSMSIVILSNEQTAGPRYTNYGGSFYTLLTYDTASGTGILNATVAYSTYFDYKFNRTHPEHVPGTPSDVLDTLSSYIVTNGTVNDIASWLAGNVTDPADDEELANAVLSLCQDRGDNTASIRYENDVVDLAKYPVETLVESTGDCEDKSILCASLLESLGFDVALVLTAEHCMVAVKLDSEPVTNTQPTVSSIEQGGHTYYICETTGYGWRVGDLPPEFAGETLYIKVL